MSNALNLATYRRARAAYFGLPPRERKGLTAGQLAEALNNHANELNRSHL